MSNNGDGNQKIEITVKHTGKDGVVQEKKIECESFYIGWEKEGIFDHASQMPMNSLAFMLEMARLDFLTTNILTSRARAQTKKPSILVPDHMVPPGKRFDPNNFRK